MELDTRRLSALRTALAFLRRRDNAPELRLVKFMGWAIGILLALLAVLIVLTQMGASPLIGDFPPLLRRKSRLFSEYVPMIPTQVREPFHRDGWVYEEKVDGPLPDGPPLGYDVRAPSLPWPTRLWQDAVGVPTRSQVQGPDA